MVPKKKQSKSKVGRHRSHQALTRKTMGVCFNCQAPRLPHVACIQCGKYSATMKPKKSEQKNTAQEDSQ